MEEGVRLFTAFAHMPNVLASAVLQTESAVQQNPLFLDLLLVFLLLLVNGFFAASEMAIVTLNDKWIRKQAEEGDSFAQKLLPFIDNPGNFLATIQVGVTIAGFMSSSFGAEKFAPRLATMISSTPSPMIKTLSLILVTLVIAYFSLVLGELVPKQIALTNPVGFSRFAVGIVRVFSILMKPFTAFLNLSTKLVLKLLRVDPDKADTTSAEEEIRMMIDIGRDSGNIHLAESEMIVNVFDFNDKEVSEIMTHRTSVVALPLEASYQEVVEIAVHEKYSRIPVYDNDIDDIVGILHIKDLLYYLAVDQSDRFNLKALLRPPYLIPESKYIDQLFRDMQRDRISFAVIIDEYGGTAGIVTMEDILEELVGNIQDEYDEEDHEIEQISETEYIIDGLTSMEDVEKTINDVRFSEDDNDDYDTVAGFVLGLLDRIPAPSEEVTVDHRNITFKVLEMDDKRIAKLLLTINISIKDFEEQLRVQESNESNREDEREE